MQLTIEVKIKTPPVRKSTPPEPKRPPLRRKLVRIGSRLEAYYLRCD